MSLSLIQGHSSVKEEEETVTDEEEEEDYQKLSEEEGHSSSHLKISYKAPSNGSSSPLLPSVIFQGRSSFLVTLWKSILLELIIIRISKGSIKIYEEITIINRRIRRKICLLGRYNFLLCFVRNVGAIVEVKPLLVGIHKRVRSDIVAHEPPSSVPSTIDEGGKCVPTATNPSAEDAAELLRHSLIHVEWSILFMVIAHPMTLATNPRRRDLLSKTRKKVRG
ncbi:hypothetical protein Peur_002419 [Populus x canadensis]